ncbi:MAG: UspA domain protein [Marmoricola sp.]|nr:UspA domain protein [Marmoricola sp.]
MSPHDPPRPIVVGIDGTAGSRAALRFALEEGLARGLPVTVVTAWMPEFPTSVTTSEAAYVDGSTKAQRLQDAEIAAALGELEESPVLSRVIANDVSGPTLTDAARGASLLVVGSGRKGVLSRAFLGSVSEFCVRHSPVPVVVVPG